MLLAQVQQAVGHVVHTGHGKAHTLDDLLSVLLDVGRAWIEVGPVGEVCLGLRVAVEHPVREEHSGEIQATAGHVTKHNTVQSMLKVSSLRGQIYFNPNFQVNFFL